MTGQNKKNNDGLKTYLSFPLKKTKIIGPIGVKFILADFQQFLIRKIIFPTHLFQIKFL